MEKEKQKIYFTNLVVEEKQFPCFLLKVLNIFFPINFSCSLTKNIFIKYWDCKDQKSEYMLKGVMSCFTDR